MNISIIINKNIQRLSIMRIKTRKKMIIILIIVLLDILLYQLLVSIVPNGVKRYYHIGNKDCCVTVWKRSRGTSYYALIIGGKYTNNRKEPVDNFIKVVRDHPSSDCLVDVIIKQDGNLLIDADNVDTICSSDGSLDLYSNNQALNDSLYTCIKDGGKCYKDDVDFVCINVTENYATDKLGNKLK